MFLQIMPKPLLFTSTSFIQKNSKEWIQHKSEKNKSFWSLNEIAEDQSFTTNISYNAQYFSPETTN